MRSPALSIRERAALIPWAISILLLPSTSICASADEVTVSATEPVQLEVSSHHESDLPLDEPIVLAVEVNGVARGEFLLILHVHNAALSLRAADVELLGVKLAERERFVLDGVEFERVPIGGDLSMVVDPLELLVSIRAAPSLLESQRIDLDRTAQGVQAAAREADLAGGMNYGIEIAHSQRGGTAASARTDLSLSYGGWSLRGSQALHATEAEARGRFGNLLLSTNLRDEMLKFELGDLRPGVSSLGGAPELFGARVSRDFAMRSDVRTTPTWRHDGPLETPTHAEVFVDGIKVKSVDLAPGTFSFEGLHAFPGLHDVTVVLRDANGIETRHDFPHYFSAVNLAAGLHDFSYSVGVPGTVLDHSVDYVFSAMHRLGLTDDITIGASLEARSREQVAMTQATATLGRFGIVDVAVRMVRDEFGRASVRSGSLSYQYSDDTRSVRLFHVEDAPGSRNELESMDPRVRRTALGVDWIGGGLTFSMDAFSARRRSGAREHALGLRVGGSAFESVQFGANMQYAWDGVGGGLEAFLFVSAALGDTWSASAQAARSGGGEVRQSIGVASARGALSDYEVQMNADRGSQGVDGELRLRRHDRAATTTLAVSSSAVGGVASRLHIEGAAAWVSGNMHVASPIRSSYALVDADGLRGVRVYHNNELAGVTDANGQLLLPNLQAYSNHQVRLDDRDVPMSLSFESFVQNLNPGADAGYVLAFRRQDSRAASGIIMMREGDVWVTVPNALIEVPSQPGVVSSTGPDGDFYMEDLQAGTTTLLVRNRTQSCVAMLVLESGAAALVDLGEVVCAAVGEAS